MSQTRQRVTRRSLTWVEIDSAALIANLHAFHQRLGPGVELMQVVKSNAYGHGLELVAREAEASGIVHRLAVISVEELIRLREAQVRLPVMLLGYQPHGVWGDVVENEGIPVIANAESLDPLSRAASERGREVPVHLKVETGTHRYGLTRDEVLNAARRIRDLPGLRLEGVATHFANIEDTTDHSFAESQIAEFDAVIAALREDGFGVDLSHAACSAAAILFPEAHYGLVRVGISSFGIWSSKETRVSSHHVEGAQLALTPALTWKTKVGQVKSVPAGGYVGYGCSWRATVDTRLAVLPVGYADGYDRHLSNVGHVLIHGRRAPVRGRVCMNVTMVDVTHHPEVRLEDEVVLLGRQGDEQVGAEDLAGWCGTIPYEIVTRIAEHLPRVRV